MTPTQAGRFTICGPSTIGPYTHYAGWDEKAADDWEVGTNCSTGHNLGLS